MTLQLTTVFEKVPEGYIAFVEELPGANTQGATLEEARANLDEAARLVLGCELLREGAHHWEGLMRRRVGVSGLALLALLTTLATTAKAQARDSALAAAAVRALDNQERLAVLNGDRAALERLWSPQLTVNAPTNHVNVGRDAVLRIVQQGGLHYSTFDRTTEAVEVIGDVAVVMGSETVRAASDTAAGARLVERRFTNVWKRDGPTWRMIARQANVRTAP